MLKKTQNSSQINFLMPRLSDQLNKKHPLYLLANEIDWKALESALSVYYRVDFGRPALPIRLLCGLLILKQLRDLSDESVVVQWSENCYYQFFTGENEFKPVQPCSPTELVNFRNRIGKDGIELIFKESIRVNGKDSDEKEIIADTTVQEKNITFPTDSKLHCKIIEKCVKIAENEEIDLRQSYARTLPKLRYKLRSQNNPKHAKTAGKARRKIKTIAHRLVNELERKLPENAYIEDLKIFKQVLAQNKQSTQKIYSLHEPHVQCISKGKDHKKYEFGSKVSILVTKTTGVIVGALNFPKNVHDSKTLDGAIEQYKRVTIGNAKVIGADLGYRGKQKVGEIIIKTPDFKKKLKTDYEKQKQKKLMKRRSSIEPVIGHLKQDHRLKRNYLSGIRGDDINVMLCAAAFNFKRFMRLKLNLIFEIFFAEIKKVILQIIYLQKAQKHTNWYGV